MATTVMTVRIDKEVKASAQEVAESAGLTISALVNSYLRQIAATRRIELYAPEPMSPKMESLIREVELDLKKGRASKPYSNANDFLRALKR